MAGAAYTIVDNVMYGFQTVARAVPVSRSVATEGRPCVRARKQVIHLRGEVGLVRLQHPTGEDVSHRDVEVLMMILRYQRLHIVLRLACRMTDRRWPFRERDREARVYRVEAIAEQGVLHAGEEVFLHAPAAFPDRLPGVTVLLHVLLPVAEGWGNADMAYGVV